MPDDYIKRSDARAYVRHAHGKGLNLMECIDAIPAADVEPVVHGRWIHGNAAYSEYHEGHLVARYYDRWTCSVCNYVINDQHYSQISYKRCPECGAKMMGEEDSGNEL